ncbi:MAG: SgcJ/EcaC family oxidoreductase [Sphingomonas sp.]
MKHAILALALCAPLAACNAPAIQNGATTAEGSAAADAVKAVENELQAAYKAKDAAKIASFYTADADITVPFQAPTRGVDQEKKLVADLADPAFSLEFNNARTEVSPGGDMAYTRGTYTVTYTNPGNKEVATQAGNYVTVFRKTAEGGWKIVQDIATPGPSAN